jgi:hypothetical protein
MKSQGSKPKKLIKSYSTAIVQALVGKISASSSCVSSGNSLGLNSKIEDGLNLDTTLILRN